MAKVNRTSFEGCKVIERVYEEYNDAMVSESDNNEQKYLKFAALKKWETPTIELGNNILKEAME